LPEKSEDEEPESDELEEGDDDDDDAADPAAEEDEDDVDLEDVPATAAGKASAARLLDLLLEKKALQLHVKKAGPALIESVAKVLESPLALKARATKLSDVIVDSEDVDELFLDDETLIELLKRW
jgi:hypothetical protein